MKLASRVAMLLLLLACDPLTPCERAALVSPSLEIGVGEEVFSPLSEGDTLPLEYGSQGGQHVWIALRAHGLDPGNDAVVGRDRDPPQVLVSLLDGDGENRGEGTISWEAFDGDEESSEITGVQLFFFPADEDGVDPAYVLTAMVQDVCGNVLGHEMTVAVE